MNYVVGGQTAFQETAAEATIDATLNTHVLPALGTAVIAAGQSPAGSGVLTLQSPGPLSQAVALTLSSSGDCSGVTFTVTGTDENGDIQTSDITTGPNISTVPVLVSAVKAWWKTWSIAVSGACTDISAGADESLVSLDTAIIGNHFVDVTGNFSIQPVFQAGWRNIDFALEGAANFAVTFLGDYDFGEAGAPTMTTGTDFFRLNSIDSGTKIQIGYNLGYHTP